MKKIAASLLVLSFLFLAGCAADSIKAPCPDYGSSCVKKPINSWDY